MKWCAALLVATLTGCSALQPFGGGQVKCPPVYEWTKKFKNGLAEEVSKLPADSETNEAMAQLVELRAWVKENCK